MLTFSWYSVPYFLLFFLLFFQPEHAKWALFPKWYPAEEHPVCLSMHWEGKDEEPTYWPTEETNLVRAFGRKIHPLMQSGCHFSFFGFAPIPLLIRLGTLFPMMWLSGHSA